MWVQRSWLPRNRCWVVKGLPCPRGSGWWWRASAALRGSGSHPQLWLPLPPRACTLLASFSAPFGNCALPRVLSAGSFIFLDPSEPIFSGSKCIIHAAFKIFFLKKRFPCFQRFSLEANWLLAYNFSLVYASDFIYSSQKLSVNKGHIVDSINISQTLSGAACKGNCWLTLIVNVR